MLNTSPQISMDGVKPFMHCLFTLGKQSPQDNTHSHLEGQDSDFDGHSYTGLITVSFHANIASTAQGYSTRCSASSNQRATKTSRDDLNLNWPTTKPYCGDTQCAKLHESLVPAYCWNSRLRIRPLQASILKLGRFTL